MYSGKMDLSLLFTEATALFLNFRYKSSCSLLNTFYTGARCPNISQEPFDNAAKFKLAGF